MTDSQPVNPTLIERYLEPVRNNADEASLPLVGEVLQKSPDRWYGQLVVSVYDSLSDRQDPEAVLPAAAAIELLRGYVRLRSRLFVSLTDEHAHPLTNDLTEALLAGDYLYTAAFSSLSTGPNSPSGDCFEILTWVHETITEAFVCTYTSAGSKDPDSAKFLEDTAGSLGAAAAAIGATVAGLDEQTCRDYEQLGRGLSTARQINYILGKDPNKAMVVPPTFDETHFRFHADRWQDEANQALESLSESADMGHLRTFTDSTATRKDKWNSATDDDALN